MKITLDLIKKKREIWFLVFGIFSDLLCHHCKRFGSSDIGNLIEHSTHCEVVGMAYLNNNHCQNIVMYRCFVCPYLSRHKGDVKKHVRKHTGEKPYECEYCDYKATQSSSIHLHMKLKHNLPSQWKPSGDVFQKFGMMVVKPILYDVRTNFYIY